MMIQNANGIYMLEGEQLWDTEVLNVALEHIKEGDTVIDAGAWIGGHTMAYAEKVGESGKVYAFEPNPYAFECLLSNARTFSNIHTYGAALGDMIATVPFSTKKGWFDSGYVGNGDDVIQVHMQSLDNYNFAPNFIKIDVEGCELKVLKGAAKTIEKYRPKMVIEINKPALRRQGCAWDSVLVWLEFHGYKFSMIEPDSGQDIYNILCTP